MNEHEEPLNVHAEEAWRAVGEEQGWLEEEKEHPKAWKALVALVIVGAALFLMGAAAHVVTWLVTEGWARAAGLGI